MNKALMISIRPEYAVNILNGKKIRELRTWIPKGYKGWVYVYVTKGLGKTKYHHLYNLTEYNNGKTLFSITHHNEHSLVPNGFLNGKVAFRFWFDEYDVYYYDIYFYPEGYEDYDGTFVDTTKYTDTKSYYVINEDLESLCLTYEEVEEYGKGKDLYAWHIKKIEIFDKPMELKNFHKLSVGKETSAYIRLDKAPQSWQYVYVKGDISS